MGYQFFPIDKGNIAGSKSTNSICVYACDQCIELRFFIFIEQPALFLFSVDFIEKF